MSRKTLVPTRRGVAGLTAAALVTGTLGVVLVGTSSAAGPVITVASVKVANPVPTRTAATIDAAGPYDGSGGAVSIVGTNFPATATVSFGGHTATNVLRLSDTLIVAQAPATTVATSDTAVDVTVGDGTGASASDLSANKVVTNGYTYKAAPVLTAAAYSTDGKSLEISGSNLGQVSQVTAGASVVKVKTTEATASKVTVKVPAMPKSSTTITATSPWGTGSLSSTFSARPLPTKIVSATGTATVGSDDSAGGSFVRIGGSALAGTTSVDFGGVSASYVVSSDAELYVQVPAMPATATVTDNVAKVDVQVHNHSLTAAKALTFSYKVAPLVTTISATTAATNSVVTVTGSNLGGAKLYFGAERNAKNVSAKAGSTSTSAQFTMPRTAATGFELGTAYTVWIVTKGGNLNTRQTLTVTR